MPTPPTLTPLSPAAPAAPRAAADPCGLESLIRPNFFAGQLLSDQDLTALLTWVQGHRGLQRYRGGWGIVCGLDVTPDGSKPGQVVVAPGYAVGPCGGDILVPQATSHAFDDVCQGSDPCSGTAPEPLSGNVDFGGITVPAKDVRVLQLSLKGKPSPMQPQPALGCRPTGPNGTACDYARIKECFEVVHAALDLKTILNPSPPPPPAPTVGVLAALQTDSKDLYNKDLALPSAPPDPKAVRAWFQGRIANSASAPRLFAAVSAMLDNLTDDEVVTKWKLVPLLFWMLLDERLAQSRPCATTTAQCVPLARVWLWHEPGGCAVMRIDLDPPYRRPLGPDGAAPSASDLSVLLWAPWEGMQGALAARGVKVAGQEKISLPATPEGLTALLTGKDQVVQALPQDTVVIQTWSDNIIKIKDKGVDRSVGFTNGDTPRKELGAKITSAEWLAADTTNFPNEPLPSPFPIGSKGVARVTVENSGEAELTFTPLLHAGGALLLKGTDQLIAAKAHKTWEAGTFTLPDKAPADGYLRLTVCGTATGSDSRSLVALRPDDNSDVAQIRSPVADFATTLQAPQGAQVVPSVLPGLQVLASLSASKESVALTFSDLTGTPTTIQKLGPNDPARTVSIQIPASAAGSNTTAIDREVSLQGKVKDVFGRRVKGLVSGDAANDLFTPQKFPLLPVPVGLKITDGSAFAVSKATKYDLTFTNNSNDTLTIKSLTVTPPNNGSFTAPVVPPAGVNVDKGKPQTFQFDFTYQPSGPDDKGPPLFIIDAQVVVNSNRGDIHGGATPG